MPAIVLIIISLVTVAPGAEPAAGEDLPVLVPDMPAVQSGVRNRITLEQIRGITGPDERNRGLVIDLKDPGLQGRIYTGPYPFESGEADYDYFRYRRSGSLTEGRGVLPIADHFYAIINANSWPEGLFPSTLTIAYRLDLWRVDDGAVRHYGFYDSVVSFRREGESFVRNMTIIEGPFTALMRSDDPSSLVISFETDAPCHGTVHVVRQGNRRLLREAVTIGTESGRQSGQLLTFSGPEGARRHEIAVSGLEPATDYVYVVTGSAPDGEHVVSPVYAFRTAPPAGQGTVTIAFVGDSREGVGGGERNYMGMNYRILSGIAADAYRRGADLFVFGGDLVNGGTTSANDFRLQLKAWKKAMAGFWRSRPVYPGMGNHEKLLNVYGGDKHRYAALDKWPYATDSAEALFAQEFINPRNGPEPSDPRRPAYTESVYSFRYGPVCVIAFNNNYWYGTHPADYGGSPEGYILDDQFEWIEKELVRADEDPAVRYVLLFAQEPVFPCGGHIKDAMWYHGNNNVRAYVLRDGKLAPESLGIIEVRNKFWKMVSNCPKVAAVLTSDEHEYYRLLITPRTPVGVYPGDDHDGDGVLDAYSPDPGFGAPAWQVTVGTGGAPYYAREKTPWEPDIITSQNGYALIRADAEKIALQFVTSTGQVLDEVEDLMAVRK